MFADVFIHFLIENNLLSEKQAKEALFKRDFKVRPATVAVYENLMTEQQVRAVMELQAANDMPFGFLAVREGYLNHEQTAAVSGRRPKEDMLVMQTLSDKGFMPMRSVMENLERFKDKYKLDEEAYEALVANKPESYVEHIADVRDGGIFAKFASVFIKTYTKCIDYSLRIDKARSEESITGEYITTVNCDGGRQLTLGVAIDGLETVLYIASRFVRQRQRDYNEDVEDSLKEFMNIVAGLFVTMLEKDLGIECDLQAPEMLLNGSLKKGGKIDIIDTYLFDGSAKIFLAEN